jgi:predicted phage terminase large subunit-like protein
MTNLSEYRQSLINNSAVLHGLLQSDFYTFVQMVFRELRPNNRLVLNWHLDALCYRIMQTVEGEDQRLLVTLPPRSLKSIIISVALPAFLLGQDPSRRIVCISYADELAKEFSGSFRRVINSPWYQTLFPGMVVAKNTEQEITTSLGGSRYATSIHGSLTGRGGNLIIIDDPLKPGDALSKPKRDSTNEWLRSTLASRPDDKQRDKMIMLMQRVHADDPAAAALETGLWKHFNLPAIASHDEDISLSFGRLHRRKAGVALDENREPLPTLALLRHEMGDMAFAAQYLQAPEQPDGGIFKREWFRWSDDFPFDARDACLVQSWDTATVANDNADWSVCTTWLITNNCFYLMEVLRKRLLYPDLKAAIIEQNRVYKPRHVVIEDKGSGMSLIQDFFDSSIPIEPYRCNDPKEVRAGRASVAANQRRVFFSAKPDKTNNIFIQEVLSFPGGRYDDQVDSMVQMIDWWEQRRQQPTALVGRYC